MRCLTLSEQLIARQYEVIFICRDHQGNMIDFIRNKGYQVFVLKKSDLTENQEDGYLSWLGAEWDTDAQQTIEYLNQIKGIDWVIVDHYAIDWRWEERVLSYRRPTQLMVIDDLANRRHTCHILLDQNLSLNSTRYRQLLPDSTTTYLGPTYALLRDEFIHTHKKVGARNGTIKNITVFYGGTDLTGETLKVVRALSELPLDQIGIRVIVGPNNPRRLKIKEICRLLSNYKIEDYVSNMAELMLQTDLFIGAGGSTTWERCMLGVPSITTVIADNQKEITEAVEHYGATWNLGECSKVDETTIIQAVRYAVTHPLEVYKMSMRCLDVIGDYQGPSVIIDRMASLKKGDDINV